MLKRVCTANLMKIVWLVLLQHLKIEYTEKLEQNQIVGEGYLQNAVFFPDFEQMIIIENYQ